MAKKSIPDPHEVYHHATLFLDADLFLRQHAATDDELGKRFRHPAMVISAFASELMLKCLLILESKTPPNHHDLKLLFDLLDPSHQFQIEALWNTDQAERKEITDRHEKAMGVNIPRDLATALNDCRHAFQGFRYLYEDPKRPSFYITFFPHLIRSLIKDITGWTD
jgi:HEPN domain-containing protein